MPLLHRSLPNHFQKAALLTIELPLAAQSFLKGGASRRWDAFGSTTIFKTRRFAPISRLRRPNNFQEAALRAAEPPSAAQQFSKGGAPRQISLYFCGASRRKTLCALCAKKKIHRLPLSIFFKKAKNPLSIFFKNSQKSDIINRVTPIDFLQK